MAYSFTFSVSRSALEKLGITDRAEFHTDIAGLNRGCGCAQTTLNVPYNQPFSGLLDGTHGRGILGRLCGIDR
jgi:hypothetical protein